MITHCWISISFLSNQKTFLLQPAPLMYLWYCPSDGSALLTLERMWHTGKTNTGENCKNWTIHSDYLVAANIITVILYPLCVYKYTFKMLKELPASPMLELTNLEEAKASASTLAVVSKSHTFFQRKPAWPSHKSCQGTRNTREPHTRRAKNWPAIFAPNCWQKVTFVLDKTGAKKKTFLEQIEH